MQPGLACSRLKCVESTTTIIPAGLQAERHPSRQGAPLRPRTTTESTVSDARLLSYRLQAEREAAEAAELAECTFAPDVAPSPGSGALQLQRPVVIRGLNGFLERKVTYEM